MKKMKKQLQIVSLICLGILFAKCQKESDRPNNISSTADSLTGKWNFIYDYRLVATKQAPNTIIDSVYSGNYAPCSYFDLQNDSTFKWYRTSMQTFPTTGYGERGTWWVDVPTRTIWMKTFYTTSDGFITERQVNPPTIANYYKIKALTKNSMLLNFRVTGADTSQYWYWHDVFTK
jgi:hypothetical protein